MGKTVLLITRGYYPHYPSEAPAGHRAAKFAKWLPKFGWTPIVVCGAAAREARLRVHGPSCLIHDTCETFRVPYVIHPKNLIRGILQRFLLKLPMSSPRRLYREMLNRARELVRSRRFDAVLASSPPDMTLAIADRICRGHHTPWVADFRDLPDQFAKRRNFLSRWHVRREVALCKSASALATVSRPLADRLASRHAAPVYVVSNGFDPEDFPPVGYRRAPYFDVVYCGTIRRGSLQDPSPFFDALDAILSEGKRCLSRMRVRFYGISRARFARCLKGRPCGKLVQIIGHRPHDEITRIEQEASVLLLLTFPRSKGIMTSKIFEYLGAHRPILSVPGDRDVADALIKETNAGVVGRTPGEIVEVLLNWYKEWEETGTVQYGGLPDIIAHYTRENQAARMAQVLDEVCR